MRAAELQQRLDEMFPEGATVIIDVSNDPDMYRATNSTIQVPRPIVRDDEYAGMEIELRDPDALKVVDVFPASVEEDAGDDLGPGLTVLCADCGSTYWFRRVPSQVAKRFAPMREDYV